jgi:hypothetical protein
VLVFFYEILIYSPSWPEHLQHVCAILNKLNKPGLFVKKSKCAFGQWEVPYLGHVISAAGVSMDEQKVRVIIDWPVPRSVHVVLSFLGLVGYYHHFIRDYGAIAMPLTKLLRKGGFT